MRRWILSLAWALSITGSFALGSYLTYRSDKKEFDTGDPISKMTRQRMTSEDEAATYWTSSAEIECIKKMWGRPLPTNILGEMEPSQGLPGADKSSLWLQSQLWEAAQTEKRLLSINQLNITNEDRRWILRANRLLPLWVQGQRDIADTRCPFTEKEAPLWKEYLTDPEGAWRRGVDADGKGGK